MLNKIEKNVYYYNFFQEVVCIFFFGNKCFDINFWGERENKEGFR